MPNSRKIATFGSEIWEIFGFCDFSWLKMEKKKFMVDFFRTKVAGNFWEIFCQNSKKNSWLTFLFSVEWIKYHQDHIVFLRYGFHFIIIRQTKWVNNKQTKTKQKNRKFSKSQPLSEPILLYFFAKCWFTFVFFSRKKMLPDFFFPEIF